MAALLKSWTQKRAEPEVFEKLPAHDAPDEKHGVRTAWARVLDDAAGHDGTPRGGAAVPPRRGAVRGFGGGRIAPLGTRVRAPRRRGRGRGVWKDAVPARVPRQPPVDRRRFDVGGFRLETPRASRSFGARGPGRQRVGRRRVEPALAPRALRAGRPLLSPLRRQLRAAAERRRPGL